jgi:hypothetical protein
MFMHVNAPALVGFRSDVGIFDAYNMRSVYVSCLLHSLGSTNLAFDLFAGPSCSIDGSRLEFAVRSRLFDHCHQPFGTVILREFAIGEGFRKITSKISMDLRFMGEKAYPMTPMDDLNRPSLLFGSSQTVLRRWKICSTYGWRSAPVKSLAIARANTPCGTHSGRSTSLHR